MRIKILFNLLRVRLAKLILGKNLLGIWDNFQYQKLKKDMESIGVGNFNSEEWKQDLDRLICSAIYDGLYENDKFVEDKTREDMREESNRQRYERLNGKSGGNQ